VITATELDAELRAIRDGVRRIRPPLSQQPEAFHLDKDAIAVRLGHLLGRLVEIPKATVFTAAADRRPSGTELVERSRATVMTRRGERRIEIERRRRAV
jgi:hypothetical protein